MKLIFDKIGFIINEKIFPDTIAYDWFIDEYNAWHSETVFSHAISSTNKHIQNMINKPASLVLPFVVDVLRNRPSHIVMIFEHVCPVCKFDGFVGLERACSFYIRLWDECLALLSPDILEAVCAVCKENPGSTVIPDDIAGTKNSKSIKELNKNLIKVLQSF